MRAQVCVLGLMAAAGLLLASPGSAATSVMKTTSSAMKNAPKFVRPVTDAVPKGTRVNVLADKLTYDGRTKIATATGTVQLTYGPYTLTATKVVYDMKNGKFSANGSIVFREPNGNVLEADFAELKENFKEGFAEHVKALLTNDVTITAHYARRYENGITVYERATYTACKTCVGKGGTPAWQIVAREAKHDMEKHTIKYKDATLEIGGVPVFYTPYLSYPDPSVKRRTGFLIPSFHSGSAYGVGVITPYFWDVAPNMDLTLSPMITTKQGVLADAEWRHRLESGTYSIRGYGIRELNPGTAPEAPGPWRGAVRTKGGFKIDDTWSWGWDGTLTSDRAFLNDYDIDGRKMVADYVQATGLSDRNYTKAQIIGWQTLTEGEDQSVLPVAVPFITGSYVLDQSVIGGELTVDFSAYSLTRNDPSLTYDLGTEQTHAMTRASWRRQMISDAGLLVTPFAELRSDAYYAQNVPSAVSGGQPELTVTPSAGFDMRMPFIADYGVAQGVLTPVVQLIASPGEKRQAGTGNEDAITLNFDTTSLFLSDRFTGFDRQEGGVRANAGLTYTLMGENGGFIRTSLGESFHIAGDNSFTTGSGLDGTSSDLVGAIALQFNDYVTLGYQARVEEDLSRINVQEVALGLTFDQFSGSLSYADIAAAADYRRPVHEQQVWGDGKYMLGEAWNLFAGFRYDLEGSKFMEKTIGVGYDCECMSAKLAYSQNEVETGKTEQKIEFSIELRTLGGTSGGFHF